MPARRIATGQVDQPCSNCGATDQYALFESEGKRWLTCSRKIGGSYCNGKPSEGSGGAPVEGGGVPSGSVGNALSSRAPTATPELVRALENLADAAAEVSVMLGEQLAGVTHVTDDVPPPGDADVPN